MAEKTVNSRIIHKHDIEANWLKATGFYPKQGEIIIYDIDDTHSYERFKIGDGKSLVSDLPFAYDALNDIINEKQGKLTGEAGQIVGFDADGNAIAQKVPTDNTLTVEGAAAEAKAVGDKMNELNSAIMNVGGGVTVANNPQALHWDGTIGDREYIVVDEVMVLVRLYDDVPDLSAHLALGLTDTIPIMISMTMPGEVTEDTEVPMVTQGGLIMAPRQEDGFINAGEGVFIVPYDNYVFSGITFPKKGIYGMAFSMITQGFDTSIMHLSGLAIAGNDFSEGGGSKYFETTTTTITEHVGDTLTWDGEFGNLLTVSTSVEINSGTLTGGYVLVSDTVLSEEEIVSATGFAKKVTRVDGSSQETQISGLYIKPRDDVEDLYDIRYEYVDDNGTVLKPLVACMAIRDGVTTSSNETLPKAGIYFSFMSTSAGYLERTSSLTINGCNFNQFSSKIATVIKTEHLPEALRFGEITTKVGSDVLTWDGNTEGLDVFLNVLYRISDATPTAEDIARGGSLVISSADLGETTATISVGTEVNVMDFGFLLDEMMAVLPSPFTYGNGVTYPAGTYVYGSGSTYISKLQINGYSFVTTTTELVKIDPKYLPDDIGGGVSLPEVTEVVSAHNTDTNAHNDIRDLISGLTTRLNALADSDDTTLDQMSEIVAYIKSNKSLIDSVTTSKVNVSDIINNLTTNISNKPLSAAQGVALKSLIDTLQASVNSKANISDLTSHTSNKSNPHTVTKAQVGLGNVENKSSATIRGEITSANVTNALGYTPPRQDTTYSVATTTTDGLMSAADKVKLDGLSESEGSAEGAVLYTEQELTEEQKNQAIANIGAIAKNELFDTISDTDSTTVTIDSSYETLESFTEIDEGTGDEYDTYYKIEEISQSALDAIYEAFQANNLTLNLTLHFPYEVFEENITIIPGDTGYAMEDNIQIGVYSDSLGYWVRLWLIGESAAGADTYTPPTSGIWCYDGTCEFVAYNSEVDHLDIKLNDIPLLEKQLIKINGVFNGQIIASPNHQNTSISLLRNSKLVSTDTNPTVNGEICWTYA